MKRNALHTVRIEDAPVIRVKELWAGYGKAHILRDLNLNIQRGCVTCIVGPSGSGKTSFLRTLNRIDAEIEGSFVNGSVYFDGYDILKEWEDLPALRRRIGSVGQKPTVFPGSVQKNLLFGLRGGGKWSDKERRKKSLELLEWVNLGDELCDRLEDDARGLSLGQQQRLAIARSLAVEPEVLMLDEPTSSLDPYSSRVIEGMMGELAEERSIIFVSHDMDQVERVGHRAIHLREGRCVQEGPIEELEFFPHKEDQEQDRSRKAE